MAFTDEQPSGPAALDSTASPIRFLRSVCRSAQPTSGSNPHRSQPPAGNRRVGTRFSTRPRSPSPKRH